MVSRFSPAMNRCFIHYGWIGPTGMLHLLPAAIHSVYGALKQSRRVELCQCLVTIAGEADLTVCIVAA
jgi:hypothetical protein